MKTRFKGSLAVTLCAAVALSFPGFPCYALGDAIHEAPDSGSRFEALALPQTLGPLDLSVDGPEFEAFPTPPSPRIDIPQEKTTLGGASKGFSLEKKKAKPTLKRSKSPEASAHSEIAPSKAGSGFLGRQAISVSSIKTNLSDSGVSGGDQKSSLDQTFDGMVLGLKNRPVAARAGKTPVYRKSDIAAARFGEPERQKLIQQARTLKALVDEKIIGQGRATKVVQDRLVQYLEGFGGRTKDPIATHLIGLPGIGKTAILDSIAQLGFKVERIDVQKYVKNGGDSKEESYAADLNSIAVRNTGKPYILLIDEIDKLPEIVNGQEETTPFIGTLNKILTDGYFDGRSHGRVDFSNAMIVTTMNFSPKEIEDFSANALKTAKKYYDFTIKDFAAFDAWIRKNPSSRYKLLSNLFRSNTVSRLAPNAVIMKPLSAADYAQIVKLTADATIEKETRGANAKKRITVSYTQAFLDFLNKNTVFAPSGARETVAKANALTEQLIHFGVKAVAEGDKSIDQPRLIALDFNPRKAQAEITVTPQVLRRDHLEPGKPFTLSVFYDAGARLFTQPEDIAFNPPPSQKNELKEKAPTKKEILAARFPKTSKLTAGLAKKIDATLIGQEEHTKLVEKEFNSYLNRPGPAANQPSFLVFAGFPGIGKSELANLTAKRLGLPLVRVNMQAYSSDSQDAVLNFGQSLAGGIKKAKEESKNGKFIILFEELDKVFEVDPNTGRFVNRPIMAAIKDLLQDGKALIPNRSEFGKEQVIDVRGAYNIITMNFAGAGFGFEADPRLTSIEDTLRAARTLAMSPAALKKSLGSMFLPETVSRLMSRFHIMNPLNAADYRKLIALQGENVVKSRLTDPNTGKNKSLIDVKMTPAYRRYLYGESVIPSEGARHVVLAVQNRISAHLEAALSRIPKSSPLATKPATLWLDFKPGKSMVVASLQPRQEPTQKAQVIYKKEVALTFPPLAATGRMPVERFETAAHEFGHAFTAVRLGLRLEYATVMPPKDGVGGYVKFSNQALSARVLLAKLYADLGSRAMERIFMSRKPLSGSSVLDITPGSSSDILQATKNLWNLIYEFGLDPQGGTIDRRGVEGMNRYAAFSDVSPETVDKLGRILRRMENRLTSDLLKAHEQSWYQDKIARFARAGGLSESEFYKLIGYPYPGHNNVFLGENSRIAELFADQVEKPLPEVAKAKGFAQGRTGATAAQNLDSFSREFAAIVKSELHPDSRRKRPVRR